jgi:hypothetical protein
VAGSGDESPHNYDGCAALHTLPRRHDNQGDNGTTGREYSSMVVRWRWISEYIMH